jgi:hypothetical protein
MKNKIWTSVYNSICGLASIFSLENYLFSSISFVGRDPVKYSVNDSAKNLVKKMNENQPR